MYIYYPVDPHLVFYSRYASKEMAHLFSAEVFSTPIDNDSIPPNLSSYRIAFTRGASSGSLSPLPRSS